MQSNPSSLHFFLLKHSDFLYQNIQMCKSKFFFLFNQHLKIIRKKFKHHMKFKLADCSRERPEDSFFNSYYTYV